MRVVLLIWLAGITLGCDDLEWEDFGDDSSEEHEGDASSGDSDTDTDTDTDTDIDGDTDSDTDMDSDTDADADTDSDTDTDVGDNYCLSLTDRGDYARVNHQTALNLPQQWTAEVWVNMANTGISQPLFRKGDQTTETASYFLYADPRGGFNASEDEGEPVTVSGRALTPAVWTHLALVKTEDALQLYIDGVLDNEFATINRSPVPNTAPLMIGANLSAEVYFAGQLDELRLSSTVRYTETFVPQKRFAVDADTLALWHFDEGTGTQTTDAVSGLLGSLVGQATFQPCEW